MDKMPCSITDGSQYDDDIIDEPSETVEELILVLEDISKGLAEDELRKALGEMK
jgi:hypothetical protein